MGVIFRNGIPYGGSDNSELYFSSKEDFPEEGTAENLYIAENENKIYRWDQENQEYVSLTDNSPTVDIEENRIAVGDGNDWLKKSCLKITEDHDGDFIVYEKENSKKNCYYQGIRNVHISLPDIHGFIPQDDMIRYFPLESFSFGSILKEEGAGTKHVYQDTCFKMLSTSKMFLTGGTEIVIGNQEIYPWAKNKKETELKIFDGAKIIVAGKDLGKKENLNNSNLPNLPSLPQYSIHNCAPDIRINGNVQIQVDSGKNPILRNRYHYTIGRTTTTRNTHVSYSGNGIENFESGYGPQFIIHDSPTFHISGSPFVQFGRKSALMLDGESSLIVRDKAICQIEGNSCLQMAKAWVKNENNMSPSVRFLGGVCLKMQSSAQQNGPLFLIEETGLTYNGLGYTPEDDHIKFELKDVNDLKKSVNFNKILPEIEDIVRNLNNNTPLASQNVERLNQLFPLYNNYDGNIFYPWYNTKTITVLDAESKSFENIDHLINQFANDSRILPFSYYLSNVFTLYLNAEEKIFHKEGNLQTNYEYFKTIIRDGASGGKIVQDGPCILKIKDLTIIRQIEQAFLNENKMDKFYLEINIISEDFYKLEELLQKMNINHSSYWTFPTSMSGYTTKTIEYICDSEQRSDVYPQINMEDWLENYKHPKTSDGSSSLTIHNNNKPNSFLNHFFLQENGSYYLRNKYIALYDRKAESYSESLLYEQVYLIKNQCPPRIKFYGQSSFDIGSSSGGSYLRMGGEDGVTETYILDNSKFELRDSAILDLRGITPDSNNTKTHKNNGAEDNGGYFEKIEGSPLLGMYDDSIFIMRGTLNKRIQNFPQEYLTKVNGYPYMAILDNAEVRIVNVTKLSLSDAAEISMSGGSKLSLSDIAEISMSGGSKLLLADSSFIKATLNKIQDSPDYNKIQYTFGDIFDSSKQVTFTIDELKALKNLLSNS